MLGTWALPLPFLPPRVRSSYSLRRQVHRDLGRSFPPMKRSEERRVGQEC